MSLDVDYSDAIEEYMYSLINTDAGSDYHVSIFHGTVSKDIYDYCMNLIEAGFDGVLIRCDSSQFQDREVRGRFSDTTTRVEILVAYNKERNKGYLDQSRGISGLLKRVWTCLRSNPMNIPPEGKCHFRRINKRKAFDNEKMQIISLQLKIKYMS
jgi:hypothetical protein